MASVSATPGDYTALHKRFVWQVPEALNLGVEILDRPAARTPDASAIIDGFTGEIFSFGRLCEEASRLTGALMALGAAPGDRVAVIGPQGPRTLVAQAAILRAGLVSVPLSERYGRDALAHRMNDSGARFAFTSRPGQAALAAIGDQLPGLEWLVAMDESAPPYPGAACFKTLGYQVLLESHGRPAPAWENRADDPALMIYTSGTTGPAKGAVHGHRVLAGHMPGFLFAHGVADARALPMDARFYTPADWAWAGGLLNLLFPALSLGFPVIAYPTSRGFDPAGVAAMMADHHVTHAFLPPTALRLMRAQLADGALRQGRLCSVMSAGEALGRETYEWARQALGFAISEAYGQTECNLVIGSSSAFGVSRPGATGKPVPGHEVFVVREDGSLTEPGEAGEIAIASPDPVMFLGYWKAQEASRRKYLTGGPLGELLMTGDMAMRDMDGYIWFMGRDDDVITSSGHRIGPGEIEDCLCSHPAVSMAAAIGVSDRLRTQIVRAYVVLRSGFEPGESLADELRAHVRANLAAHEYPRELRFIDALPMTTTGKIIRRLLKNQD